MDEVIQVNQEDIHRAWNMRLALEDTHGIPPSGARILLDDQRGLDLLVGAMFNRLVGLLNDNDDTDVIMRKRHEIKIVIEQTAMLMLMAASTKGQL